MVKNSDAYWKQREANERKWIESNIKSDADFDKIVQKHYDKLIQNINKDISDQYIKYAGREGISLAEAQKAVSRHDVQAFSSEAKEAVARAREIFKKKGSVAYSDFEESLNQRLRLYNATMRINRLEYLKANLGLELINTNIDVGSELAERLKEGYSGEVRRQAGILGESIGSTNIKNASKIVMAQTKNANFSDRLWSNSDVLKTKLDSILTQQYVQGINPRVIATKLRPLLADNVKNARYVTERLARTESARVAATAQLDSFKKYGYDYVKWIAEPSACKICTSIASTNDGVYSLKDVPYLPAHANCRCSIAAWNGGDIEPSKNAPVDSNGDSIDLNTITEQQLREKGEKVYDDFFTEKRQNLMAESERINSDLKNRILAFNKGKPLAGDTYAVLKQAQKDTMKAHTKIQNQLIKEANRGLAKHRSVGLNKGEGQTFVKGSVKTNMNRINNVLNNFPSSWGKTSKERPMFTKSVKRGYCNGDVVAISGTGASAMKTTYHEMGHRMEFLFPNIRRVEHEFYQRRTQGEQLQKLSDAFKNANYRSNETTRVDHFINPYMGKDYGNKSDSFYELLSMGMEGLYTGSIDLEKDKDFANFILGIVTTM
ncbi:minor capsid protein [Pediococcus pentosaceus]|uniref:minor capsid protein n=1 Tax=Pediococcus pentosaceus TaxID=1255 RepID=UPI002B4C1413|nr:minor capsid protein [Pediococcus pentosaceus]MEB3377148.1 minor capsid protein [Pediococcus pentosaceus]